MNKQDRSQALTIILTAYGTAQGALIILKATGTIGWNWAAILWPSLTVAAIFLAIIIAGTIVGISGVIREHKTRKAEKDGKVIHISREQFDALMKGMKEEEDDG